MIQTECSVCGKSYKLKNEYAGKTAKCGCGAQFIVSDSPRSPTEIRTDTLKPGNVVQTLNSRSQVTRSEASVVISRKRFGQRPLQLGAVLLVSIVVACAIAYIAWLRPQNAQITKTLNEAATQRANEEAIVRKTAEQERVQEQEKLLLAEEARLRAEEEAKAAIAQAQVDVAIIRAYITSAEGFIREVKAMRGRIDAGTSFQEFTDKLLIVFDEYAQIESTPDDADAVRFSEAAAKAMEHYQRAQQQWAFAVRNNMWLAEKYKIRETFDCAEIEISIAIQSFNSLKLKTH